MRPAFRRAQPTDRSGRSAAARRGLIVAALSVGVIAGGACSSEGDGPIGNADRSSVDDAGQEEGSDEAPADEQPAEQAPPDDPEPDGATEEPAAGDDSSSGEDAASSDDGLATEEWLLLILIGAVLVAGFVALLRRGGARDERRAETNRRVAEAAGGARSVHDQAMSVMQIVDPGQQQAAWSSLRTRAMALEGQISALAPGVTNASLLAGLQDVERSVAELRSAMESYLSLRTTTNSGQSPDGYAQFLEAAELTALQRNQQLDASVQSLLAQLG